MAKGTMLLVLAVAAMGLVGCVRAPDSPTTPTATVTAAPHLISVPIGLAEITDPDIAIEAVDLGPGLIDGVDQRRPISNKNTWRISAQCDEIVGSKLKVGALKEAEYQMLVASGSEKSITDNALKSFLNCP